MKTTTKVMRMRRRRMHVWRVSMGYLTRPASCCLAPLSLHQTTNIRHMHKNLCTVRYIITNIHKMSSHKTTNIRRMHKVSEPWLHLWYQIRTNGIYLIKKIYDIFWCPSEPQNGKHGQNKTLAQNSTTAIIPTARHKQMWKICTKQQKHSPH